MPHGERIFHPNCHVCIALAPISCPASPTVPPRSTHPTRTSHCPGALPVANAVPTHPTPPPRGQSPGKQRRRAHKSVDDRPAMWGWEGKLGGVGGAQSASLPSTCKGAPPRTSPDAQTPTSMRFHPVLRAPAPPVHASPWSTPPSSSASRRSVRCWCHRRPVSSVPVN